MHRWELSSLEVQQKKNFSHEWIIENQENSEKLWARHRTFWLSSFTQIWFSFGLKTLKTTSNLLNFPLHLHFSFSKFSSHHCTMTQLSGTFPHTTKLHSCTKSVQNHKTRTKLFNKSDWVLLFRAQFSIPLWLKVQ